MNHHIRRICIIGAECTGKTTLAKMLSARFGEPWVPEFARNYLDNLGRPYEQNDLVKIAEGQLEQEQALEQNSRTLLICDTNLLVIKVWSEHKYGFCDPKVITLHTQRIYHHYILTDSNITWEEDPQREHPDLREYFQNIYRQLVQQSGVSYTEVSGTNEERLEQAHNAIKNLSLEK
jgi:nicotinamide riboside kinase